MPFIDIDTNAKINAADADKFIESVVDMVANTLNKPRQYIIVNVRDGLKMGFGGVGVIGALITVRAIGFGGKEKEFALKISELTASAFGIDIDMVNLNLTDIPMNMVGQGGSLFG